MESKNNKSGFSEVIIVEGRDDTKRLQLFFPGIETIETNGSEISEKTLAKIKKLSQKRELIILTDPDFNGERIRKKVQAVAPNAKQAFLSRSDAVPSKAHGSLGVEHASKEALQAALKNLHEKKARTDLTREDLIDLGLIVGADARQLREFVGEELGIGYANAQQFSKRLVTFGVTLAEVKTAVEQWRKDEKTSNR